ncbi:MAG: sulfur carrier protein ThiS [Succinivibrio sp.]|nr:sulfur carrier protein ThiS [Succinivibrio sp.]
MKIIYQDHEITLDDELTLLEFVRSQGLSEQGVAAAVNEEIIPKRSWAEFRLADGMQVDIFNLVAGG